MNYFRKINISLKFGFIFFQLPNTVGFVFGLLQIILYFIYKNSKVDYAEEEHKIPTSIKLETTSDFDRIHPVCSLPIQDDQILENITVAVQNGGEDDHQPN